MKKSIIIPVLLAAALCLLGGIYYFQIRPSATPRGTSTSTSSSSETSSIRLKPVTVNLKNGKQFTLQIPEQYTLRVAAEGLKRARFMTLDPDRPDTIWIGEMGSAGDTSTGRVVSLEDFDAASGKFRRISDAPGTLRNPNSLAFYKEPNGGEWIYVALTDKLVRAAYPSDDSFHTVATFPDYGQPPSEGGWHLTRTVVVHNDKIYVSIGSSCNSCEEKAGELRAMILEMNPDGSGRRVVASGLRNAVGITFAGNDLFATANEADHLGNDKPNDVIYKIKDGSDYGWPYCYESAGSVYRDTTQSWKKDFDCATVPLAWAELPPHSAPLGLKYVDKSFKDPALRDAMLVAMHGSGKPALATGYAVAAVREGQAPLTVIGGFLENGTRAARPVDILLRDDHSFFVSDDLNGAVYFLEYSG